MLDIKSRQIFHIRIDQNLGGKSLSCKLLRLVAGVVAGRLAETNWSRLTSVLTGPSTGQQPRDNG